MSIYDLFKIKSHDNSPSVGLSVSAFPSHYSSVVRFVDNMAEARHDLLVQQLTTDSLLQLETSLRLFPRNHLILCSSDWTKVVTLPKSFNVTYDYVKNEVWTDTKGSYLKVGVVNNSIIMPINFLSDSSITLPLVLQV